MVDPLNITSFTRTTAELEEFILNAIAFAGKNAVQQSHKMHALLYAHTPTGTVSPFETISRWKKEKSLMRNLKRTRIGKYALLARSYTMLAESNIDLHRCSVEELETFHGIGPKTARFFLLHSRPGQEVAVLDTHIMKEMKRLGFEVPKNTPHGKQYLKLERIYIEHLKKIGVTDFAAHDLATWKKYTKSTRGI